MVPLYSPCQELSNDLNLVQSFKQEPKSNRKKRAGNPGKYFIKDVGNPAICFLCLARDRYRSLIKEKMT